MRRKQLRKQNNNLFSFDDFDLGLFPMFDDEDIEPIEEAKIMATPQISPRKVMFRTINERLEDVLKDIKKQQKLLAELKKDALALAKQEREKAKLLSPRKPTKKGRRKVTRKPLRVKDPFTGQHQFIH